MRPSLVSALPDLETQRLIDGLQATANILPDGASEMRDKLLKYASEIAAPESRRNALEYFRAYVGHYKGLRDELPSGVEPEVWSERVGEIRRLVDAALPKGKGSWWTRLLNRLAGIRNDPAHRASSMPFFIPYTRGLNPDERSILQRILGEAAPEMLPQVEQLRVVGRCGCAGCPIVFFEAHHPGKRYGNIAVYSGRDASGGLVGVVPMESGGRLSQLDFFSIDGHEPWQIPDPSTLGPMDKGL